MNFSKFKFLGTIFFMCVLFDSFSLTLSADINDILLDYEIKGNYKEVERLLKSGANRASLVFIRSYNWWYCKEYVNDKNCIERMSITFENKSYSKITNVTFMLTIKSS